MTMAVYLYAGAGVGVQRGVRGQLVVRADSACLHRSVTHA